MRVIHSTVPSEDQQGDAKQGEVKMGESKVQYWRDTIKRWQESGLTKTAFCRRDAIRINTFNIWYLRLSRDTDDVKVMPENNLDLHNLEFKIESCDKEPEQSLPPLKIDRTVAAVLSDNEGKNRLTIYEGARPETINAIMATFLK